MQFQIDILKSYVYILCTPTYIQKPGLEVASIHYLYEIILFKYVWICSGSTCRAYRSLVNFMFTWFVLQTENHRGLDWLLEICRSSCSQYPIILLSLSAVNWSYLSVFLDLYKLLFVTTFILVRFFSIFTDFLLVNMTKFLDIAYFEIPTLSGLKYTHNNLDEGTRCVELHNRAFAIFLGCDQVHFLFSLSLYTIKK